MLDAASAYVLATYLERPLYSVLQLHHCRLSAYDACAITPAVSSQRRHSGALRERTACFCSQLYWDGMGSRHRPSDQVAVVTPDHHVLRLLAIYAPFPYTRIPSAQAPMNDKPEAAGRPKDKQKHPRSHAARIPLQERPRERKRWRCRPRHIY